MNTTKQTTDVFIVEDSPAIRARLVELLSAIDDVRIVGQADTPAGAVQGIFDTQPHCVVLDIQLIGGQGIEVIRAISPHVPHIDFIVLTNHATPQYRRFYMEAGARWFFDKTEEFERIKEALPLHSRNH
ncbi:response regulator transcription factor [Uliginosibacterium sediminicola]|jgi:DNA-binding NarL/FixJ family response regulator|uniref:Response regulator transcription factor n=1 Tax=Uliginosibacterium sediminicola TaxID=2024550 RepID=A0ABU9Z000_9RHOO